MPGTVSEHGRNRQKKKNAQAQTRSRKFVNKTSSETETQQSGETYDLKEPDHQAIANDNIKLVKSEKQSLKSQDSQCVLNKTLNSEAASFIKFEKEIVLNRDDVSDVSVANTVLEKSGCEQSKTPVASSSLLGRAKVKKRVRHKKKK